ncbi:MAG: hypothetical protein IJQ73_13625 [Kiritimatiellae bacterium]|nr:hypothetical protein [Kiritimatiellia bacterium]
MKMLPAVPPRPPAPAPAPQPAVQAPTQKPPPDKAILDNPVVKTAVELFHGSVADVIRPVPADAN